MAAATQMSDASGVPLAAVTSTLVTQPGDAKAQAEDYLRKGRAALRAGNLQLAETYLRRIEKLGVDLSSGGIFSRFQDTPAKLRADLAKAKQDGQRPSTRYEPSGGETRRAPAPTDPFRARSRSGSLAQLTDGTDAKARTYLQKGRAALDAGNKVAATFYYKKAVAEGAEFAADEYSPSRLRSDLLRAGVAASQLSVAAIPGGRQIDPDSIPPSRADDIPSMGRDRYVAHEEEGAGSRYNGDSRYDYPREGGSRYARDRRSTSPAAGDAQKAQQMLHQARRAIAEGDLRKAATLVSEVDRLKVGFGPGDDTADDVDRLIREAASLRQPRDGESRQQLDHRYARFLKHQADGLRRHGDRALAEKLARKAQEVGGDGGSPTLTVSDAGERPRDSVATRKREALALLARAKAALDRDDVRLAERLTADAQRLDVPEDAFAPGELQPWLLQLQIRKIRSRQGSAYRTAAHQDDRSRSSRYAVAPASYDPRRDDTRTRRASAEEGPPLGRLSPAELFRRGERALDDDDKEAAIRYFSQAWERERELDPAMRKALQTRLQILRMPKPRPAGPAEDVPRPDERISDAQRGLWAKIYGEVRREQARAQSLRAERPKEAYQVLNRVRRRVADSELEPALRKRMLTQVDRSIVAMEKYIDENRVEIERDERNRTVLAEVDRRRNMRVQVGEKMAELVSRFNKMMDEHRYAEAQVIARQANELDPTNPVVRNLLWKSKFASSLRRQMELKDDKERGFVNAMYNVERSSEPFDDSRPFQFGDVEDWKKLSKLRKGKYGREGARQLSKEEIEIYKRLDTQVDVSFENTPLQDAIRALAAQTDINIVLDEVGLSQEGITSAQPITLKLRKPIRLRSALQLILERYRLGYVVDHEVLKITSEQNRENTKKTVVYYVADLVIPIPNFLPNYNIGLPAAIREAHNAVGYGQSLSGAGQAPLTVLAGQNGMPNQASTLAQMQAAGVAPAQGGFRASPVGFGPGGAGGGAKPDFDTITELITSTVEPESWTEVGGSGTIEGFPTNLSLVVSQTQEVHEQIADLLEQLRRLQDLQVTIEVRFITLSDNFFERIGIDFDFDIDDNITTVPGDDTGPSVTLGLDPTGAPTADLDVQFSQGGFGAAVPAFGGFDAASAANFGFAILSDIEAFFVIQAAQGDTRTNVMQAPKVTLFNGQSASVSDTSQTPFVTSVIPVVGDFAAAHQPVIVVLSEGTSLTVQAVASKDRRFVRLTVVPFFSRIGDVEEFTFEGSVSTDSGTVVTDPDDDEVDDTERENQTTTREGTTVQLPTFSFVTVTTTVSVPDGGTVLLGGIKRLSEGRSEIGVPVLSKVPYINRLFRNVGIGREAQSLMLMVTPRIIIQEEEEENL